MGSVYCYIIVQVENPGSFFLTEPFLVERSSKQIEEKRYDLLIVRFCNANGEAYEQSGFVDEEDALATFDGEDVAVPISDGRQSNDRGIRQRRVINVSKEFGGTTDDWHVLVQSYLVFSIDSISV